MTPTTAEILAARGPKEPTDPRRPAGVEVELECGPGGTPVETVTVFLTGRECPFRCVFCDLWRYTLDGPTPPGALAEQLDFALAAHPVPADGRPRQVKLYNASNWWDPKAVPPGDLPAIADRVRSFSRVIVENHPRLTDARVLPFRDLLRGTLEVAVGLETVHPGVFDRLNKGCTRADVDRAVRFLVGERISVRCFVLLRPPWLTDREGVEWAVQSVRYAFDLGAEVCSVVPVRGGNGVMDRLAAAGVFAPPSLSALEETLDRGLSTGGGRVFVDLWDADRLFAGEPDAAARIARLRGMNLSQKS